MIPVRLTLHNFLSYGDAAEPIDFTGLRVACLSGSNGHGKSALLDAITWVLWGQARSSSADDLVRLGQTAMMVEFEFDFDEHRYRVIRKRSRGRSGQSDLQFQIRMEDESFRTLTEQGVRGTQERIIQTLRMDYETFINSAFILQGRADEFARKGATDRKRILSEILNLRVYDELVEEARVRARDAEQSRITLDSDLRQIDLELAEEPRHEKAKAESQAKLLEIGQRQQQRDAERAELNVRKINLEHLQLRAEDLTRRIRQTDQEVTTWRGQFAAVEARLTAARALLAEGETIREQVEQLHFARAQEEQMRRRLVELRQVEAQRQELERALLGARKELEGDLKVVTRQVDDLRAREAELPLFRQQEADLDRQVQALDRLEEEAERANEEAVVLKERRATLVGARAQWAQAMEEADERFLLLKGARARCPVCEGELKEEQRRELGWKLKEQLRELHRQTDDADRECQELDAKIAALTRQVTAAGARRKTGQAMRDRLAQARQVIHQIEVGLETLPSALAHAERLQARLDGGDFSPEHRRDIAALDTRIAAIDYDDTRHQAITRRVQELQVAEAKAARLDAAQSSVGPDEAQSQGLRDQITRREQESEEDRTLLTSLREQLEELPAVVRQLAQIGEECSRIQKEAELATRELGAAQSRLDRCREQAEAAVQKRRDRDTATRDKANYEDLMRIFGKNGIQALIIENAIPEIEAEANAILERMSESGMRVALLTQRDTKTAGVAETLDIEISDQVGTRKYELFSGGEALRVNFALRIALSKLLARRAGARLQTLVIDEGFGSQDADGRDKLVEAIHSIQDDFEKILIITHLDELKDAFPTRLEVTKDHRGSHVTIV